MMRYGFLLTVLLILGCRGAVSSHAEEGGGERPADQQAASGPHVDQDAADQLEDLGTRKTGVDWPRFLGPTGDSKSPEEGIVAPWPDEGPPIVWQREIGTGYGIGCVAQGRYFHFDRWDRPRERSGQMRLTCLEAETGEELWRFEYPSDYEDLLNYSNGPRCSPVVDGNRVYIFGPEGMLHCLRASDGEVIWKIDTSQKYHVVQNFFGVGSTPVIEEDLLICMVGGSPPGSPGLYESRGRTEGDGSGIVAFNKYTGDVEYEITDELASYASPQLATIDDRRWCFVFARGGLVGFEPLSGQVDFHYPWKARSLESVNASTPVVVGSEVFISETYGVGSSLLAVRPGDYEVVWRDSPRSRDKAMEAHWNTPIYVDGYLYGCSGRNPPDADLRCIDWETGEVMWVEQEPRRSRARSSLLYVDGHFVCLGEYGSLKLLKADPEKYELVSEVLLTREAPQEAASVQARPLLKYPCWAAPILSHGLLYVQGADRLVCLELIPDQRAEEE